MPGTWSLVGTISLAGRLVTSSPAGSVPAAVAVLRTRPASTSDWTTVYAVSDVQSVAAAGASVVASQVTGPATASETVMPLIVTLPLLVTTKE